MYVKTGRVMEELAKAFPIMNDEEIIDILIEKVQKGNKTTVNRDKWRSGVYILMYDEPCTALTNVLKKLPNVDMDGIFAKSLPDNATIAVE